jgi:hypothetical protein
VKKRSVRVPPATAGRLTSGWAGPDGTRVRLARPGLIPVLVAEDRGGLLRGVPEAVSPTNVLADRIQRPSGLHRA